MGRGPCSAEFYIVGISPRSIEKANDVPIIPAGRGPPPADRDYPSGLAVNQPGFELSRGIVADVGRSTKVQPSLPLHAGCAPVPLSDMTHIFFTSRVVGFNGIGEENGTGVLSRKSPACWRGSLPSDEGFTEDMRSHEDE